MDAVIGTATEWAPVSPHGAASLAADDTRVYTGIDGQVSGFDASSGASLWETITDSYVDALAVGDGVLFAGGIFNVIDGQPSPGLAALDPGTGHLIPWDSGPFRGATGLAVAGDQLFGVNPGEVFSVPVPGAVGARHVTARAATSRPMSLTRCSSPVAGEARLTLAIPEPGPVSIGVFDLQGRRIASVLDHVWLEAGAHEHSIRTSNWPRGLYFVRVDLAGRTESHRIAVIR